MAIRRRSDRHCTRCPRAGWGRRHLWWQPGQAQQQRALAGAPRGRPVPVIAARAEAGRAGLSRRRRHRAGPQHRHRAAAGRRQAGQHRLHGRPGRRRGLRAGARSTRAPTRPPTTRRWPRRRRTRRRSPMPGSTSSATPSSSPTTPSRGSSSTPRRRLVAQLEAQVRLDQAAIDNAKAILDYTTIMAPIAGRTGIRLVDQGNIVRAADATGIVVITQLQPIAVIFTLPQQQLGARSTAPRPSGTLPVDAFGPDNKTVVDDRRAAGGRQPGRPDDRHDQAEGRISQRDCSSGPAQFINVRLLVDTLQAVIVVPTAAVQRGPNGTFVYVVEADSTVAMRPVRVASRTRCRRYRQGVDAGERVVTTGFARLAAARCGHGTNAEAAPAPGRAAGRAAAPRRRRRPKTASSAQQTTPQRGAPERASNERFRALHPAADRDLAAGLRGDAGRLARLSGGCRSRRCRRSTSRPSRSPRSCPAPARTPSPRW